MLKSIANLLKILEKQQKSWANYWKLLKHIQNYWNLLEILETILKNVETTLKFVEMFQNLIEKYSNLLKTVDWRLLNNHWEIMEYYWEIEYHWTNDIIRQHFSDTIPKPLSFVILGVTSVIVSSSKY